MGRNPFISEVFHKVNGGNERQEIVEGEPAINSFYIRYVNWRKLSRVLQTALWRSRETPLYLLDYQAGRSLGRRLQKGWKEIPLKEDGKTNVYNVKMHIKTIEGFSGHSEQKTIMEYVKRLSPKPEKIMICATETTTKTLDLASSIYRSYKIETKTPMNFETIRIQ